MTGSYAIECDGLRRVFRSRRLTGQVEEVVALDSLSLQVQPGEVYGVLGPNGAGKTTAIRIFSTLLIPTAGSAQVMGHDVVKAAGNVRRRIGLILGGERGLYERLTGRQNLQYFASLYLMNPRRGAERADAALEDVGLTHAADRRVEQYSRGMRQRLHVARGLLPDPDVIFMDEPTIGLDPEAAQDFRRLVPELRERGKTVLLTTHYMLEADVLCERIAVIDHGRLVALDTPEGLKRRFGQGQVTEATLRAATPGLADRLRALRGVTAVESDMEGAAQRVKVYADAGRDIASGLRNLAGTDAIQSIVTREPSLEEAYLSLIRESSAGE
ncbi:MAG: ABC transporter ATP-binding protein [Chloroflexota bacterium]|nr:ABC transporter ATP-binding protein [Chloroflexota bacterium]